MLGQLILPLLQQVGGHDNEGGLDRHSLPLVVVVLVQAEHRPARWRWVGQDKHQTLQGLPQALWVTKCPDQSLTDQVYQHPSQQVSMHTNSPNWYDAPRRMKCLRHVADDYVLKWS